jgi:glycyl-tRNA synthetase alpha chain
MLTMQSLIEKMKHFWAGEGCLIAEPYDLEKGAGTMNPETFLRVLGPLPYASAYVEPCRRPRDGRYGENPQRVEKHHQFQVIMKPTPDDIQERYLRSLETFGIDLKAHDLRFEEDNWEAPTLGAWGVGWQVMLDGTEITQFTYFQQAGGFELKPITVEITYGIERLCMFLNGIGDVYDIPWNEHFTYGDMRREAERQFSVYDFDEADAAMTARWFDEYESESNRLLEKGLYLPAYDFCLKASHAFNILDARGAISVAARADYVKRVRRLACAAAAVYMKQFEDETEADHA